MHIILVNGDIIAAKTYTIQLFYRLMYLVQMSDSSHGDYPRVMFMTVFAQHPETTYYLRVITIRPRLFTGKL